MGISPPSFLSSLIPPAPNSLHQAVVPRCAEAAFHLILLADQTATNWDRRKRISNIAGTASFTVWLFAQSPQLYENYRRKSVAGLSGVFLTQWIVADVLNLVGALLTNQLPFQIAVAAYFCCVDCVIIFQWIRYSRLNPPPKLSRPRFERHHARHLFPAHAQHPHTQAHRSTSSHRYRPSLSQSLTLTRPTHHHHHQYDQQSLLSANIDAGTPQYSSTGITTPLHSLHPDGAGPSRRAQSHPVRTMIRTVSGAAPAAKAAIPDLSASVQRSGATGEPQLAEGGLSEPPAHRDGDSSREALSSSRARSRSKASLTMTASSMSTSSSRDGSPSPSFQEEGFLNTSRSTSPARGRSSRANTPQNFHASAQPQQDSHQHSFPSQRIISRSPSSSSSYRLMAQEALRVALLAERLEERRSRSRSSRSVTMMATDAGGYFAGKYNNLGVSLASSRETSRGSSRRSSIEEQQNGHLTNTSFKGKGRDIFLALPVNAEERETAGESGFTITAQDEATARPSPEGSQSPSRQSRPPADGRTSSWDRSTEEDSVLPLGAKLKGSRRAPRTRHHSATSEREHDAIPASGRSRSRKRKAGSAIAGVFSLLGIGSLVGLGEVGDGVGFWRMPAEAEVGLPIATSSSIFTEGLRTSEWRHPVMLYPQSQDWQATAAETSWKVRLKVGPLATAAHIASQGRTEDDNDHRHHRHNPPPTLPPPSRRPPHREPDPIPVPGPSPNDPHWPDKRPVVDVPLLIGRIASWICTILYTTSRLPQLYLNARRRSVEGLSILLFVSAFLGNSLYSLSILASPEAVGEGAREYLRESMPFLLGSGGTLVFDAVIVLQWWMWGRKKGEGEKRKERRRGRGRASGEDGGAAEIVVTDGHEV